MKQKILLLFTTIIFCFAGITAIANPESEPNNTRATANNLALGGSNTGAMDVANDEDWFKVTTTGDGKLNITLNVSNGLNLKCYIYDYDGTIILSTDYTATSKTISVDGLAAGTYYVKLAAYFGNELPVYTVSSSLTEPAELNDAEPNNTKAQAKVFLVNKSKTGHNCYYYNNLRDTFDWYKITTPQDGRLQLKMTSGNGQIIWVYLYDHDGTTLLGSGYTAGSTFLVDKDGLAAGTYYIRVNTYYNFSFAPYTLSNTFTTYSNENDTSVNDASYQAVTMRANEATTGHVNFYYNGKKDAVDWHKINYTGSGNLTLNVSQEAHISDGNHDILSVQVFKDTLGSPISSQNNGSLFWQMNLSNLTQGYYYVKVSSYYNYDFESYSIQDVFIQGNIAKITAKSYDTLASCSSTNNIIFQANKSVSPYMVQLYRFGVVYGAPVLTSKLITFNNLPTGSYYAIAFGDGATGTAFGKSKNVSVEPVPVNLSSTNITKVTATLKWNAVTCAGYYTVQYRVQGNLTWTTRKTVNTTPGYALKGLIASTTYEWHVATSDSANGIVATGQYSAISIFTTASAFSGGNNGDEVSLFGKGNIKEDNNSVAVFPNPASNYFTIRYSSTKTENVNAILYNMNGKAVWTSGAMNASALNGQKVAVSQFASGIYYLKIMDEKGAIQSVIKVSIIK